NEGRGRGWGSAGALAVASLAVASLLACQLRCKEDISLHECLYDESSYVPAALRSGGRTLGNGLPGSVAERPGSKSGVSAQPAATGTKPAGTPGLGGKRTPGWIGPDHPPRPFPPPPALQPPFPPPPPAYPGQPP